MEPDYWGNSDNFEVANVLSTPEHIIPEVYFDYLFYLLRSICIKFLGMCCIVGWMMICMVQYVWVDYQIEVMYGMIGGYVYSWWLCVVSILEVIFQRL